MHINGASPPGPAAEVFSPISVQRHTVRLWDTTCGSGSRKEKQVSAGKSQQAFQSSSSSPCHESLSAANKETPGNGPWWRSVPLLLKRVAIQTEMGGHWGSPGLVAMALHGLKALCAQLSSPRDCGPREVTGLISCSASAACSPHAGWDRGCPRGVPEPAARARVRGTHVPWLGAVEAAGCGAAPQLPHPPG